MWGMNCVHVKVMHEKYREIIRIQTKHNRWRSVYMQSMRHVLKSNSISDRNILVLEVLTMFSKARGIEGSCKYYPPV